VACVSDADAPAPEHEPIPPHYSDAGGQSNPFEQDTVDMTLRKILEAKLSHDWQPEGVFAAHARELLAYITPGDVGFAMRQLVNDGVAERKTPLGARSKHYRLSTSVTQ
jgi:hypothetical protein